MFGNTVEKNKAGESPRQTEALGFLAFLNQERDGSYAPARMVRENPARQIHRYFTYKSQYTGKSTVTSARRNYSRRQIVTLRIWKGGCGKDNIAFVIGLALELDGIEGEAPKSLYDVYLHLDDHKLPLPTYINETSPGHFHLIWLFQKPLPWTPKNARYWESQERRLVEVFAPFGPDINACLNPVQFYQNWTQLNPYNHKRKCDINIHRTGHKTSMSAIQHALDRAGVLNEWIPRIPAETLIRQDLRQRKYITETYTQWGKRLGLSKRTMDRVIPKLIENGDLIKEQTRGNNKPVKRTYFYKSMLYIEPRTEFNNTEKVSHEVTPILTPKVPTSFKELRYAKETASAALAKAFRKHGARENYRNKTAYAVGRYEKWKSGGKICAGELKKRLMNGLMRSENYGASGNFTVAELDRTVQNVLKSKYIQPLSRKTLAEWGLSC